MTRHPSMPLPRPSSVGSGEAEPDALRTDPTVAEPAGMTPLYAILGILLIIVAIPLGLMLTPLVIGAILLYVALKRTDRALQASTAGPVLP